LHSGPPGLEVQRASHTPEGTRADADWIERVLGLQRGARVLDVPCGAGRLALELAGRGYQVGLNRWYLVPGRLSRDVLKVRHGVIEEIGLTFTLIRTRDDARLVVPNEKLVSDTIRNSSIRNQGTFAEITVQVPLSTDLRAAVDALQEEVSGEREGSVTVTSLDGNATVTMRAAAENEELLLRKELLDKQIVDVDGRKVVRVNDLKLAPTGDTLRLIAADIAATPDLVFDPHIVVVSGDRVACRLVFRCTPRDRFLGFTPNGGRLCFAEHVFYRFEDGPISAVSSLIDRWAIAEQLRGRSSGP